MFPPDVPPIRRGLDRVALRWRTDAYANTRAHAPSNANADAAADFGAYARADAAADFAADAGGDADANVKRCERCVLVAILCFASVLCENNSFHRILTTIDWSIHQAVFRVLRSRARELLLFLSSSSVWPQSDRAESIDNVFPSQMGLRSEYRPLQGEWSLAWGVHFPLIALAIRTNLVQEREIRRCIVNRCHFVYLFSNSSEWARVLTLNSD